MGGGRGVADRGSAEFLLIESTKIMKKSIKIKKTVLRGEYQDNGNQCDEKVEYFAVLIMNTNKTI